MAIYYALEISGGTNIYIAEIFFSAIKAIAWTYYTLTVSKEIRDRSAKYSHSLRLWWFLSGIIAVLKLSSSIIRIARYGFFSYEISLRVDDVVAIASFPVSLFLLCISANGHTGFKQDTVKRTKREKGNGSLSQPFLSNVHHEGEEEEITGYYTAGFLSKTFWLWLNPLLYKGKRTTLQIKDVPELSPEDKAERLYLLFESNWLKIRSSNRKHPVRSTILRSFGWQLASTALIAFVKALSMYVGPLLIQNFVDFLESDPRYYTEGYMLVFILLFAKFVEVLSTHHYQFLSQKLGMMIRSCLITSIYRKGLRLSSSSRQSHGVGRIVNYMTVDVQQINDSTQYMDASIPNSHSSSYTISRNRYLNARWACYHGSLWSSCE